MKLHIAGGCGEHGRNCFHVMAERTAFLVDCGLMAGEAGGGYPRLGQLDISGLRYVFLTHSHTDHTGALPWLWQQGYAGPVIASRHTLEQLPFPVKNSLALEDLCPDGEGTLPELGIRWGKSGHCVGSVWYEFSLGKKTILFSGDYTEDTQVFRCAHLRNRQADFAVLDCAYGHDTVPYGQCCEDLLQKVQDLQNRHKLLLFPVPKFGRGTEILRLLLDNGVKGPYWGDAHFCRELSRRDLSDWYLPERRPDAELGVYTGAETEGIVFLSDPQLRTAAARENAKSVLEAGGIGIMTGTVEHDTFSAQLLQENAMVMQRYPVHLNEVQYQKLIHRNCFRKALPYHSPDFPSENMIEF